MQDWRRRRRPSKRPSVVVPFVPRPSRWRVDGIDIRLVLAFILPLAFVVGGMLARDAAGGSAGMVEKGEAAIVGVASVIDGDTIEVHGRRIRLEGIDAPESKQTCIRDGVAERCGQQAALHLSDRIGRLAVACEPTGTDRYGRTLAICSEGGEDLNGMMVRDGDGRRLPRLLQPLCRRGGPGPRPTAWHLGDRLRGALGLAEEAIGPVRHTPDARRWN